MVHIPDGGMVVQMFSSVYVYCNPLSGIHLKENTIFLVKSANLTLLKQERYIEPDYSTNLPHLLIVNTAN